MILRRVRIRNFRSIREVEVALGPHTAIIGGNGTGKSSVLHAIERFYSASAQIELDDFFGRRTEEPIEIELTFGNLDLAELAIFQSHVHAGEMTVVRVFEANAGRNNGRYYGMSRQHLPFHGIRAVTAATEKRAAYNALRAAPVYSGLPPVIRADQIENHLSAWENQHPEQCELGRDSGQFFGFSNVGRGSLQRITRLVFIPAVRDAVDDAVDAKGAVVARLMELVVRNAIQRRADIRAFQAETTERYRQLTDPGQLTELGGLSATLTDTLRGLYLEASVNLRWREPDEFAIPLPTADVLVDDDGFEGPVDRKGHGLQRALILTLLQHLAYATADAEQVQVSDAIHSDEATQPASESISPPTPQPVPVLPGLILAIEEPELYQHPTKQRHFANVLRQLSNGLLSGVAARTQVIFASHSSLFVVADRFDEIRLARRTSIADMQHKECVLRHSTLASVCRRLEVAFLEAEGTRTVEGLRSRLHVVGPELSEGFFADLVVLVEGPSDRAAIVSAASIANFDLAANGIAILPVNGKSGLANPICIFQEFQIPTFAVWDSDRGSSNSQVPYNRALQRLSGVAEVSIQDFANTIGETFAAFDVDLESTLRSEFGSEAFDRSLDQSRTTYGLQSRADVIKSPAAMMDVLRTLAAVEKTSDTLNRLVQAIAALRLRCSIT